ncbi:glutathione S-transferase family protein [Flavisphingomonas formosensis]|uniref:glutathione S-transferase family protein n=1 Tax=Flavisphingomonas formosensis TaxID=861534 RepID=UPI0012FACF0C|nr:glutathione S-transferase family protein [Sphingomonas formosensis]
MLTLYYAPGACSLVPHIALEEAGADYRRHRVNYAVGENNQPPFRTISPLGRVPVLLTDRGALTENPAILSYIAQSHPEAGLAPLDDPFAFARVQSFNLFISANIHVAFRQIVFPDTYADGEEAAKALRDKVPELADRYFAVIEQGLADGRLYVHGDRFTLSDAYLSVYANYLRKGDRGDVSRLPNILAHRARIRARPAVQRILEVEGLADEWRD